MYPDRSPGSEGNTGAAQWYADKLAPYRLQPHMDTFSATIPGRGRVKLRNVMAVSVGRSPQTIVVMAHRDNTGQGPGANDNASGTAALIELARAYSRTPTGSARGVSPEHTIVFLSTDGGAFGGLGAQRFAEHSPYRGRVIAVVNLDALAGHAPARLELAGDQPRSPAIGLVQTAATRITEQSGNRPGRTSTLGQLIDLGFPFSLYEQAPFVGGGVPAVTITTAGNRPPPAAPDTPGALDIVRLGQLGKAAESLVVSLDKGPELAHGASSYVYLGSRLLRGWAIELGAVCDAPAGFHGDGRSVRPLPPAPCTARPCLSQSSHQARLLALGWRGVRAIRARGRLGSRSGATPRAHRRRRHELATLEPGRILGGARTVVARGPPAACSSATRQPPSTRSLATRQR